MGCQPEAACGIQAHWGLISMCHKGWFKLKGLSFVWDPRSPVSGFCKGSVPGP